MSTDHIRYDLLTQEALRGMVRRVLADTARAGLPGDHHFFISFKTGYPGVNIPARLAEKFPEEITIVLQHQFWDLSVSDYGFEVGLSFGNAPEKLVVPFDAVTAFFDPSVEFGVKFEVVQAESEEDDAQEEATVSHAPAPARSSRAKSASSQNEKARPAEAEPSKEAEAEPVAETSEKIVSLDHFRKKK